MPFSFLHVLLKPQLKPLFHALFAFLLFHLLLRQSLDEKSGLRRPFSSRQRKRDGFFFHLWILGEFDSENSSDPRKQAVPHLDSDPCSIAWEAASNKGFRESLFGGLFLWENRRAFRRVLASQPPVECSESLSSHEMRNEIFKLNNKREKLAKSRRNVTPCKKVICHNFRTRRTPISMTHSTVRFQVDPASIPSLPSWMEEVAVMAHLLAQTGINSALEEHVQFARARFG